MQCCCDSGRCWSEGSTPELCPIRGSGGLTFSSYGSCCLLHRFKFQIKVSNIYFCLYSFLHSFIHSFIHVTTLEDYQKLCIQIPDGNGGGPIPGRVPGSPDIPSIYPLPYPAQPIPDQGPIVPGHIPIQVPPGHIPGQTQILIPGQYPVAPPPLGWFWFLSLFSFSLNFTLKNVSK